MSIRRPAYFILTCDGDGCTEKVPHPNSEFGAWSDYTGALEDAYQSDWTVEDAAPPQPGCPTPHRHFCPDHAPDEEQNDA